MADVIAEAGPGPGSAPMRPAAEPGRSFAIIPVRGLPIVAVILVALVVAIASNQRWALDFFHVAGGGLWTGIDLFVGLIIGPILASMPVPARIAFSTRFMPKMLLVM